MKGHILFPFISPTVRVPINHLTHKTIVVILSETLKHDLLTFDIEVHLTIEYCIKHIQIHLSLRIYCKKYICNVHV